MPRAELRSRAGITDDGLVGPGRVSQRGVDLFAVPVPLISASCITTLGLEHCRMPFSRIGALTLDKQTVNSLIKQFVELHLL